MAKPVVPSNLRSIIVDFTADLTVVFPEYAFMWSKWATANDTEYEKFHAHCLAIYPERFFDILYTNADIFKEDNKAIVSFLPDVNFRLLFNCAGVSDKTKTSIWKYLQLILFTVLGSVNDPKRFGDAANLFEAMDENELHAKMAETLESVGDFFKNIDDTDGNNTNEASTEASSNEGTEAATDIDELSEAMKDIFKGLSASADAAPSSAAPSADNSSNSEKPGFKLPNPDILKEHLKTLLEGKLGKLAKEFTDEFTTDLKDFFDENDALNMKSSKDVLMKLIKDPQKMMLILKKITSKLQDKMKRGEISQEELMGEMAGLMEKMKDMGGGGDFADMMKGLSGTPFMKMFEKGMGGAKMDMNKVNQMSKQSAMKDRLRKKLEQRKAQAAQLAPIQLAPTPTPVAPTPTQAGAKVIPITDKNFVVKIGNSVQEKSGLRPSTAVSTPSTFEPSKTEQIASVSKKNKGNKKSK
jgi:hypothetical protein